MRFPTRRSHCIIALRLFPAATVTSDGQPRLNSCTVTQTCVHDGYRALRPEHRLHLTKCPEGARFHQPSLSHTTDNTVDSIDFYLAPTTIRSWRPDNSKYSHIIQSDSQAKVNLWVVFLLLNHDISLRQSRLGVIRLDMEDTQPEHSD